MGAKTVGSRSMKIAPVSSFRVEMRPLKRLEKKESGIQVSVWREVLNLGDGVRRGKRRRGEDAASSSEIHAFSFGISFFLSFLFKRQASSLRRSNS